MATRKASVKATVSVAGVGHNSRMLLLSAVCNAAMNIGKGDYDVAAAIKAAGGDQDDVKAEYQIGHIMGASGKTREDVLVIMGKEWNDSKGSKQASDKVQSVQEYHWRNNAKTGWFRALVNAGLKSTAKGAGNANAKAKGKGLLKTDKVTLPTRKAIKTDVNIAAFVKAGAVANVDLFKFNAKHKATKTKLAEEIRAAVIDHLDCLNTIIAKYEGGAAETEADTSDTE